MFCFIVLIPQLCTQVIITNVYDELESLFDKLQLSKIDVFHCGDFNMHIMKHHENRGTQEFIDGMLSAGLRRDI